MPQRVSLRALHPTQMTLGLREVARRRAGFLALEPRQRTDYIVRRVVPCVRGPARQLYLVDRHHMCRALLEADAACARVAVIEDIGDVDICEFWRRMDERGWAHPYDRQGQRRAMTAIPASLAMLEDDPYRTLAGVLRREKAYAKADLPFEEFAWANFLRSRIPAELIRTNFADAGSLAMTLAASQEARHLPGWIGQVR